jgi:hypothetical protein
MPSETGLRGTECYLVFPELGKDPDCKWVNWMAKLECALESKKGVLKGDSALVGMPNRSCPWTIHATMTKIRPGAVAKVKYRSQGDHYSMTRVIRCKDKVTSLSICND